MAAKKCYQVGVPKGSLWDTVGGGASAAAASTAAKETRHEDEAAEHHCREPTEHHGQETKLKSSASKSMRQSCQASEASFRPYIALKHSTTNITAEKTIIMIGLTARATNAPATTAATSAGSSEAEAASYLPTYLP